MRKCEQCLYYPKCDEYPFDESGCKDFKDKSLFIEMPCKVGDTVWFTTYGHIPTCTEVYKISCNIGTDGLHSYFETQDFNGNADYFHGEAFGKTVFLTREEAEAELAERKMNDMDNKGKFKPGTRFIGNISKIEMEVVEIKGDHVLIRDLKTGMLHVHGLRMIEKCDVTILE